MWELHITVCVCECVCANICELSVDHSASFSPPPSLSSSPFFRLLLLLLFLIHSHCYLLFFLNRSAALITQEWLVLSLKICVCVCVCAWVSVCARRGKSLLLKAAWTPLFAVTEIDLPLLRGLARTWHIFAFHCASFNGKWLPSLKCAHNLRASTLTHSQT